VGPRRAPAPEDAGYRFPPGTRGSEGADPGKEAFPAMVTDLLESAPVWMDTIIFPGCWLAGHGDSSPSGLQGRGLAGPRTNGHRDRWQAEGSGFRDGGRA